MLQGKADPRLLATYEHERRPVALANTALSVSNWQQALKVPTAMGLDPRAADILQAVVMSKPASLLPQGARPITSLTSRCLIQWTLFLWKQISFSYAVAACRSRGCLSVTHCKP